MPGSKGTASPLKEHNFSTTVSSEDMGSAIRSGTGSFLPMFVRWGGGGRRENFFTAKGSIVDPDSLNTDPDPAFQVIGSGYGSRVFDDQKLENNTAKIFFLLF